MGRTALTMTLLWVALSVPKAAPAQEHALEYGAEHLREIEPDYPALEARVWLDRGVDPVLRYGERTRIYYRVSEDAYIAILHIDTNGTVRIAYPASAAEAHYARGGRDYRLLFPDSPYWHVSDEPGVGYFFIVASPTPMDFSAFLYSARGGGWDLTRVGQHVYRDPYVAMDDYVALLVPDWEYDEYALDFSAYHVGQAYSYPRFLCYDCHVPRSFSSWNPYHYSCHSFRIVVYNDPYFYPSTRYRGSRVVYARPPAPRQPQFVFKERAAGEPGTPMVQTRPATPSRAPAPAVTPPRRSGSDAGLRVGPGEAERRGFVPERGGATGVTARPSQAIPDRGARAGEGGAQPPRAGAGGVPANPAGGASPPAGARNVQERAAPAAGSSRAAPPVRTPGNSSPPPATGSPVRTAPPAAAPPAASGERPRPVLERRPSAGRTPPPASTPPRATPPRGGASTPPAATPPRGGASPPRPAATSPPTSPPARSDPPASTRPPARSDPPSSRPAAQRPAPPPAARAGPPPAARSGAPPARGGAAPPPRRPPGGGAPI